MNGIIKSLWTSKQTIYFHISIAGSFSHSWWCFQNRLVFFCRNQSRWWYYQQCPFIGRSACLFQYLVWSYRNELNLPRPQFGAAVTSHTRLTAIQQHYNINQTFSHFQQVIYFTSRGNVGTCMGVKICYINAILTLMFTYSPFKDDL